MYTFRFTRIAKKQFNTLPMDVQTRILALLKMCKNCDYFHMQAKRVVAIPQVSHRLRVGRYRILVCCDAQSQQCVVVVVGHRKDVYR